MVTITINPESSYFVCFSKRILCICKSNTIFIPKVLKSNIIESTAAEQYSSDLQRI